MANKFIRDNLYGTEIDPIGALTQRMGEVDGILTDIVANKFGVSVESFPLQSGETNDTARIQRAINSISSGFVVLANKTYNVTTLTMKTGVFLYSLNATLKLINNAPAYTNMLYFQGVSNTGVLGTLNIDGNRANNGSANGTSGTIGVKIVQGCADLYFGTLAIKNTTEDGFYVGGTTTPQPQNINVQKMIVDNVGRNGISITSGQDMFFGDVITRNTNGVAPQAGVDIETNVPGDLLTNINFESLTTYGNVGCGFQIVGYDLTNLSQGHVTIKKLVSRNNQSYGALITGVSHIDILSGAIYSNTIGLAIPRNVRHLKARLDVFNNGLRGIDLVMTSQNLQSYDFDFSGCHIYNNSKTTANSLDGIRLDSDDVTKPLSRVYLDECVMYDNQVTPTQRYGLSTGTSVEKVRGKCDFYGNATSDKIINATKSKVITFEQTSSLSMTTQTVNANSTLTVDLTATGILAGGRVNVTPSIGLPTGIIYSAFVFSNNTIRIVLTNVTASSIAVSALTWYMDYNN